MIPTQAVDPEQFQAARPFPHAALDGMWPNELLVSVLGEMSQSRAWQPDNEELTLPDKATWGPATKHFWSVLEDDGMFNFVEMLTGFKLTWEGMYGGPVLTPPNCVVPVAEVQEGPSFGLQVYLSPRWDSPGGWLELHDGPDNGAPLETLAPEFNTTFLFCCQGAWIGRPIAATERTVYRMEVWCA